MVDDELWAQRTSARLSMYGVVTTHTPEGDPALADMGGWPIGPSNEAPMEDTSLFPSCFYAQMLSAMPNSHRSVSVPPTPRASIAVDAAHDSQRLASRILTHVRHSEAQKQPKPLLEEVDTAVLARAQALNSDLNEMLQWAQQQNQRSAELRRQLEHSRLVRFVTSDASSPDAPAAIRQK